MSDRDFAPDGRHFGVVSTGGYARNGLCEAAARWETSARGAGLQPTWVDRSGGDSFTAVDVSGAAIYVGGHGRWLNNNPPNGTSTDPVPRPGAGPPAGIPAPPPPHRPPPARQPRP